MCFVTVFAFHSCFFSDKSQAEDAAKKYAEKRLNGVMNMGLITSWDFEDIEVDGDNATAYYEYELKSGKTVRQWCQLKKIGGNRKVVDSSW